MKNFVASTTSSRRPFSALPTMTSGSPWENTSGGVHEIHPGVQGLLETLMLSSQSFVPQSPNIMSPRHVCR